MDDISRYYNYMFGNSSRFWEVDSRWLKKLGFTYEIRIRLTLAFMFVLILIANLNSLRYFALTQDAQEQRVLDQTARNLRLLSLAIQSNPMDRINSQPVRDLADAAGFLSLYLIETDVLRSDPPLPSILVPADVLAQIHESYGLPKKLAGGIGDILPASVSEIHESAGRRPQRSGFFHFVAESGAPLTLVVTIPAEEEGVLADFATLNTLFQILSVLAALTMAIMLLKITMKPYQQIKSEAIAADVAHTDRPESMDFAVEAFQKVIAELKTKEQKLEQLYAEQKERAVSLELYTEDVLRSMPSGVLSCNRERLVTHFNESAARILGVSTESVLNQSFEKSLSAWPLLCQLLDATLEHSNETAIPEIEIVTKNKTTVWLTVVSSLVTDQEGNVRGATMLITDITSLKKLEAEIVVKEQMAAIGEMSAGLAHQLRNSMGAIIGFAQLLTKISGEGGPYSDMVSGILKEARTTGDMLDRFLKLSKVGEIATAETSFEGIFAALQIHFENKLKERGLSIEFVLQDNLPRLVCDQLLLQNSLLNLIENAIQASSPGEVIRVSAKFSSTTSEFQVDVADSGKGISQDQLSRIFAPFYTYGKADGTGLGLALARKWIMAHGGSITCESQLGKGTRFRINLPEIPLHTVSQRLEDKIELVNPS